MLLARQVSSAVEWTEAQEHWQEPDFPFEILNEFKEGRKGTLSVFHVANRDDPLLLKVAAAKSLNGNHANIKAPQFRFVDTDQLKDLNVEFKQTPAELSDKALDDHHFELSGIIGPTAVQLARIMMSDPKNYSREAVLDEIVLGIVSKRLDKKKVTRDLIWLLYGNNSLGFLPKDEGVSMKAKKADPRQPVARFLEKGRKAAGMAAEDASEDFAEKPTDDIS